MTHLFKLCGQRIAYDTNARKAHKLSPLAFKMIESLTPPLKKGCPSPLRYAFAKYDSAALSSAYDEIYDLYIAGELFRDEPLPETKPDINVLPFPSRPTDGITTLITLPLSSNEIENAISLVSENSNTVLAPKADYSDGMAVKSALEILDRIGAKKICPIHEVKSTDDCFSETVSELRKQGFTQISLSVLQDALNDPDKVMSEYEQIFKTIVRSDDKSFVFYPFIPDYISATNPGAGTGCLGCFAYGICHGAHSGAECDIIRKQTECALANTAE